MRLWTRATETGRMMRIKRVMVREMISFSVSLRPSLISMLRLLWQKGKLLSRGAGGDRIGGNCIDSHFRGNDRGI